MAVTFARALYSFEGGRSDNLSFKEGEIITVLKQDPSGWWQGSTLDGRIGIFPRNYVELNEVRDSYDVALAEYNFESDKDGDLNFKEGEEIIVLRHMSPEWWFGRTKDKREGVFPSNYVKLTGEVDYATADEEAAKWNGIISTAKATAADIVRRREAAEKELELERQKLEHANQQAAAARMANEAEAKKERDAKQEEMMQKHKAQEVELAKNREEAERRHEEARLKLQAAKLEEETTSKTIKAAEEKKDKAKKDKADDDRFADFDDPGKKPVREVKKVNKFAGLGGGDKCPKCGLTVGHAEKTKGPGDTVWHVKCFKCSTCDKALTNGNFSEHNNQPYCPVCYGKIHGPKGFGFGGSVVSDDGAGVGRDRKVATGHIEEESPLEALKKKKG